MADKKQRPAPGAHTATVRTEHPGETLDMDLKAEEQRRSEPYDPEAEEELSGSPT